MTANAFASLGPSTFTRLVAARQAVVAAGDAHDVAESACTCAGHVRRCVCEAARATERTWREYQAASDVRAEMERSWADYCAIRYGR